MDKQVKRHISVDAECHIDEEAYVSSLSEKYITKYVFGWFRMEGKYTRHEPKLPSIEGAFKRMIGQPLEKLLKIDRIYGDFCKFFLVGLFVC